MPLGVCGNAKGLVPKTVLTGSTDGGKGAEGNSLLSPADCRRWDSPESSVYWTVPSFQGDEVYNIYSSTLW